MASILWISDSPARLSGFGITTRHICERLVRLGHDLHPLAWWSDAPHVVGPLTVLPCPTAPDAAAAAIIDNIIELRPDWVVTLSDIPWIHYMADKNVQRALSMAGSAWLHYYPIDSTMPDGTLPAGWVDVLSLTAVAVAMSEFGRVASARSGIDAELIPQGVDVDLFHPPDDKAAARSMLGYQDRFVVLSDVRNHRRKLLPRILDIARGFRDSCQRIVFHVHTNLVVREDLDSYSYDLLADIKAMGLDDLVKISDCEPRGIEFDQMARLYQAADAHLLMSWGEGFGLPTIQAAASGVVPIAPANSASAELVDGHGIAIGCDGFVADEFGLMRGFASRAQVIDALGQLRANRDLLETKSLASRQFALRFNWDDLATRWDALLSSRGRAERRGRRVTGAPGLPDQFGPGETRPTGHSSAVLPIPRINIPTRLMVGGGTSGELTILADAGAFPEIRNAEYLFPAVRISRLPPPMHESDLVEYLIANRVILAVDADPFPLDRLDVACVLAAASYIGPSPIWPPMTGGDLFSQVRLLLTDFALAEERFTEARGRVSATCTSWVG